MSSRDDILRQIRTQLPQSAPLPPLDGDWIRYPDRVLQFQESLQSVGGALYSVENAAEADAALRTIPAWTQARKTFSCVPGIGRSTFDFDAVDDPHALADVDFAILRGEFAVAENGAIWTRGEAVKHRAVYFLTQHLALVVPRSELVDQMHEAYARLTFGARGFGAFISGPSKTADIEQSLVIGAHGARSLSVFLVDSI